MLVGVRLYRDVTCGTGALSMTSKSTFTLTNYRLHTGALGPHHNYTCSHRKRWCLFIPVLVTDKM